MGRLSGKVAVVTGAGHGIGAGIARRFASEGAAVLVFDRDPVRTESVTARIAESGGHASALVGDVTISDDVRGMISAAVERFGGLDILVNNAALTTFGRAIDADDMEARYDLLMATNLKSAWMALHHAVPHFKSRGGGSVISIASVHGLASNSHNSAYAASKGALIAGTHALAVELAPHRIRVNCISPGLILSESPDERNAWLLAHLTEEQRRAFDARFGDLDDRARELCQPLPVVGLPDDIAHAAIYLASDESRFCTGTNLVVDGGAMALLPSPTYVSPEVNALRERQREMHIWLDAKQRRE